MRDANDRICSETMRSDASIFPTKRALMACLCIVAMLSISLNAGLRAAAVTELFVTVSVQKVLPGPAPAEPHKSCPSGSHSRSVAPCASSGLIGLEQSTADQLTSAEQKLYRFAMAPSAVLTNTHGSRLERPPRF